MKTGGPVAPPPCIAAGGPLRYVLHIFLIYDRCKCTDEPLDMYAEQRLARFRGRARWIAQGRAVSVKAGRPVAPPPCIAAGGPLRYALHIFLLCDHCKCTDEPLYMYAEHCLAKYRGRARWIAQGRAVSVKTGGPVACCTFTFFLLVMFVFLQAVAKHVVFQVLLCFNNVM